MNCHNQIKTDSEKLAPIRESWETDKAIEWVRVNNLADYAYFNHAAHVNGSWLRKLPWKNRQNGSCVSSRASKYELVFRLSS